MDTKKAAGRNHHPRSYGIPAHNLDDQQPTKILDVCQAAESSFLVGSITADQVFSRTCPSAKTIVAFSDSINLWCLIQIRCKRWGCRTCGERKMTRYAWRVKDAEPNRLVTLTVNNPLWSSPRAAYDGTCRAVTQLAVKIRRQ